MIIILIGPSGPGDDARLHARLGLRLTLRK